MNEVKRLLLEGANIYEFGKHCKIAIPEQPPVSWEFRDWFRKLYDILYREQFVIVLKPKKIGFSWGVGGIYALHHIMHTSNANVLMTSRGEDEAVQLLKKPREIYQNLPPEMKWPDPNELEPDNQRAFGFKATNSRIRAYPATEFATIGEAASIYIADEFDFHPFAKQNYVHTRATVESTGGQYIIGSTVDKTHLDTYFKQLLKEALTCFYCSNSIEDTDNLVKCPSCGKYWKGANGFFPVFFSVYDKEEYSEAWYQTIVDQHSSEPWMAEGNYPRSIKDALSPMAAHSVFKEETLKRLWEDTHDAPEVRRGMVHIFHPPRVGTDYACGADVGEGVGLDYSVGTILGRYGAQKEVCAIIYSNTLATDLFAYELYQLCEEYFNCLLGVENNSLGVAVLNKLLELNYKKLYYSEIEEKKKDQGKDAKPGWNTGEKSKQILISELTPEIDNGSIITRFRPQVKELMEYQFVQGRSGMYRADARGKTHGDTVISLEIANQMIKKVHKPVEASVYIRGRKVM